MNLLIILLLVKGTNVIKSGKDKTKNGVPVKICQKANLKQLKSKETLKFHITFNVPLTVSDSVKFNISSIPPVLGKILQTLPLLVFRACNYEYQYPHIA